MASVRGSLRSAKIRYCIKDTILYFFQVCSVALMNAVHDWPNGKNGLRIFYTNSPSFWSLPFVQFIIKTPPIVSDSHKCVFGGLSHSSFFLSSSLAHWALATLSAYLDTPCLPTFCSYPTFASPDLRSLSSVFIFCVSVPGRLCY